LSTRKHQKSALFIIASILCITLGNTPSTQAAPAAEPAPEMHAAASAPAAKQSAPRSEPPSLPVPAPAKLRRLKGSEMSVPLVKKAREIINEHYKKPFGTDIEFELDGKRYVGRIERHYHPPGGELRPWGHHAGCSLFIVESDG
jgi:hypothetical protein